MARIICIDDEVDLLEDLREELEAAGHEVLEAVNGEQGFDLICRNKPDMVICDRGMPILSGYELLSKIRTENPGLNELPFVFLTALADRRDVEAVAELEPTAYVTKPVDFDDLLEIVDRCLPQQVPSA